MTYARKIKKEKISKEKFMKKVLIIIALVIVLVIAVSFITLTIDENNTQSEELQNQITNQVITENEISEKIPNIPVEEMTDAQIEALAKIKIQKYIDLEDYSAELDMGAPEGILYLLELTENVDYQTMPQEEIDGETYYKTEVKYDDFKNEMLKYITKEKFEKEYYNYKNINGYVGCIFGGYGIGIVTLHDMTLVSKENEIYKFNFTVRDEEMYEHVVILSDAENLTEEDCFFKAYANCKIIDDELIVIDAGKI